VVFYTQTLAFAPNDYKLLNNLGMEYAGRQDLVNAAKYYNLAINIQPDVAVAYYNLGNLLLAQNQEQKALEKYVRALEVDPKFLYAYPPVIEIYSQEGNKEMAQKYYQQYSGIIRGK
jgi:tetratricopeptide (TPR) repeat protein